MEILMMDVDVRYTGVWLLVFQSQLSMLTFSVSLSSFTVSLLSSLSSWTCHISFRCSKTYVSLITVSISSTEHTEVIRMTGRRQGGRGEGIKRWFLVAYCGHLELCVDNSLLLPLATTGTRLSVLRATRYWSWRMENNKIVDTELQLELEDGE